MLEEEKADKLALTALDKKVDDLKDDFRYIRSRLDEIHNQVVKNKGSS